MNIEQIEKDAAARAAERILNIPYRIAWGWRDVAAKIIREEWQRARADAERLAGRSAA